MAWDCEHWGSLPDSGGLYDQDYVLMDRMRSLGNVHKTITKLRGLQGAEIHRLSVGERRLLHWLMDEGVWQM